MSTGSSTHKTALGSLLIFGGQLLLGMHVDVLVILSPHLPVCMPKAVEIVVSNLWKTVKYPFVVTYIDS